MFYNTDTRESIFFPATGTRQGGSSNGALAFAGVNGFYWTSSSSMTGSINSWYLKNDIETSSITPGSRSNGFPIHCIWEECKAVTSVAVTSNLTSTPLSGAVMSLVTLTASVTAPSGANQGAGIWEYLDNVNPPYNVWKVIPGSENTTTCITNIMNLGAGMNQYRYRVPTCGTSVSGMICTAASNEESSPRITWDAINSRYALAVDPRDAGLYFKFGSIVGMYTGSGGVLKYPDNANGTFINIPTDIPWVRSDFNLINRNDLTAYSSVPKSTAPFSHTRPNVLAGLGDPCRLVGLDLSYLSTGPFDNGVWRLSTDDQNSSYNGIVIIGGGDHWWSAGTSPYYGVPGGSFPSQSKPTVFLPATVNKCNTIQSNPIQSNPRDEAEASSRVIESSLETKQNVHHHCR